MKMDSNTNISSEELLAELQEQKMLNERLLKETEERQIYFNELESTNTHLITATWREREIKKKLQASIDELQMFFNEMQETNNHLISATWREREIKRQLKETLDELSNTKILVEKQNQRISESINYARKIQLAINATQQNLKEEFPESFIYYRPKDVISGDFPWYYRIGDDIFFAAVDCTGHGVPGAMLSIIGNLILNDIISNNPKKKTSEILTDLHRKVVQTLKQDNPENISADGMDIALCKVDLKKRRVYFSGAHRPLLYVKNGVTTILKGDRFPIGGMQYKNLNNYTEQMIPFEKGDALFIFSDGYPDQVGGEEKRKFSTNQLNELLIGASSLSASEIENKVDSALKDWMGDNKQVDDVLVIGVKF